MAPIFGSPAPGNGEPGRRGYDRVKLVIDGESKDLSRAEYERLPLQARIRSLLEGSSRFFVGPLELSAREALRD
jgi:hypothetical protein